MVTIGFSPHRVEALPFAREHMAIHQLIVLEEPPTPYFASMLQGDLSIADYLLKHDSAFPEFTKRMCLLLRDFHRSGKRVSQVEPYLEKLQQIHELFRTGKKPDEVMRTPSLKKVYMVEKRVTETLIDFYASSVKDPFEKVVESVKLFAQADARRLNLRAQLRAKAIASLATLRESIYVEAGYMHFPLFRYLSEELADERKICVVFLLTPVINRLKGKRRNLGPGDVLTLHYSFHNAIPHELADLLAGRSLIYTKLIRKEELLPGKSEAPHSEDEAVVNRLVDSLNYNDCRRLYHNIRLATRERASYVVEHYVKTKST